MEYRKLLILLETKDWLKFKIKNQMVLEKITLFRCNWPKENIWFKYLGFTKAPMLLLYNLKLKLHLKIKSNKLLMW
jgi:hypothetical protein